MKKLVSILLLVCVLLTTFVGFGVLAADTKNIIEFLANGSFEELNADGTPAKWDLSSKTILNEHAEISKVATDGSNGIHLKGVTGVSAGKTVLQNVSGINVGSEYTLSADVRVDVIAGNKAAAIDIYFKDAKGNQLAIDEKNNVARKLITEADGKWHKYSVSGIAPANAVTAQICVRVYDDCEGYFDNVSFTGESKQQVCKIMDIPEGSPNLFKNSGFEELDASGNPTGWEIRAKDKVHVVQDGEHGNVLRFNDSGSSNPWARQEFTNLEAGVTYQISADLKTLYFPEMGTNKGPSFKIEMYFKGETNPGGDMFAYDFQPTNGMWQKVAKQFVLPEGIEKIVIYARLYSKGEIYYDNIELHKVAEVPYFDIYTPHVNYTEWKQGTVDIVYNYDMVPGLSADVTIKDKSKTVLSETISLEKETEYKYDISVLEKYGEEYTITVKCKDANGNVLQEYTNDIYRFNRPSNISENGLMINGNGEEFAPVVAYHVLYEDLGDAADNYGVNVVRCGDNADKTLRAGTKPEWRESTKKWLDTAWYEHGIMTMITLYSTAFGTDLYYEHAFSFIEELGDHPGILGYILMDEPYNDWYVERTTNNLKTAYLAIRRVDDKHPVVTVANRQAFWVDNLDWNDFSILDRYPTATVFESLQYKFVNNAKAISDYTKPIWDLAQVCYMDSDYIRTGEKLRNMIYQMYFARGEGVGYFGFSQITSHLSTIKDPVDQDIAAKTLATEFDDAAKAFLTGEYPTFSEYGQQQPLDHWGQYWYNVLPDDYYYKAYVKEGELYLVILNNRSYDVEVEIPLTSYNGKIALGEFSAELVGEGALSPATVTGNGVFKTTIKGNDAPRYKITSGNVDYTALTTSNYYDLMDYNWARDSINTVKAAGIVNDMGLRKYAPEKNITRADFAGYLIRTLGLTADATDTFADVDDSYTYAKEIAIGKALGILNGVGDNKYNPDAPISRQDLMVICTRGMKAVKDLNLDTSKLDAFADAWQIADYAREGITGMVTEGIVKGNTDGTINPLGNTTRAEAAVIMERILNWK